MMWITLSYNGINDGISFTPIYLMMFKRELSKIGIPTELWLNQEEYDYSGIPSDNLFHASYQNLTKFIEKMKGSKIDYANDLLIDFSKAPDTDIVGTTTAFGCKNHCFYCPNRKMGYIQRNTDNVLLELQYITSHHKYFEFFDNNVLLNPDFMDIIEEIPDGVEWGALINIDFVSRDKLKRMYEKGCRNLYIGLETFNEDDLRYFGKPFVGLLDPKEFLIKLREIGFNVYVFLIRGLPNEKLYDMSIITDWLDDHSIYYTISRFYENGQPVKSTEHLSPKYLKRCEEWDMQTSRENLNTFLENYKNI